MTDQITITTSPDDSLPIIMLRHHIYGEHEINMSHVSIRDHADVRLAAEVELDLYDYSLRDVPVVDERACFHV
jgi:hypothetical protein